MRSCMVRDPGNRFMKKCLIHHIRRENQGSRGLHWDKRIMKLPQRVRQLEPSSDLRGFLATLCPQNLQHVENPDVVLQVRSCFQNFQRVLTHQQHQFLWYHGNTHDCTSSVYQNWNEGGRLTGYGITCSKLETFLTRQRPILQFQLFE